VLSIAIPAFVEVTAVPALPAESPNEIEYPTFPSPSSSQTMIVHVHPAAVPVAVDAEFSIALVPSVSVKAQTGAVVTSVLDVKVIVMTSASLAAPSPFTETTGVLSVGCVLSMVTEPVPEVTAVPALPAASVYAIE
jgi:hypothetical protein